MARNIRQEKFFATCLHGRNFYHANFLSCIDDYTEDMATFTTLAKIYSSEYFCNAMVAGIGEIFVQRKFLAIQYIKVVDVLIINSQCPNLSDNNYRSNN